MFKAILLNRQDGQTQAQFTDLEEAQLPPGDVTVRVDYSTLNYKDALAVTGRGAVIRKWPMVPGIDLAGTIEASADPRWPVGADVVVTGWGLGEEHWGGLAQKARLPGAWLLALPQGFSARTAMAVGTAGFTAALCVMALRRHGVHSDDGDILVTGAAGGVGSIAIALLAAMGYRVVAATGRMQEAPYLRQLGAAEAIDRAELQTASKPLQSERWAGVIDVTGGQMLVNACAAMRMDGAVAACGLAHGADFPGTVLPFILRGVTLYGINSVYADNDRRHLAWDLLARHLDLDLLASMTGEIGLSEVIDYCPGFLAGTVRGRTVVDVAR